MRSIRTVALVAAVISLFALGRAAAVDALGDTTTHVVLVGDSLAWEASGGFTTVAQGHQRARVDDLTFGGTAICDWLPRMPAELARFHPRAAVLEFSGDAFTPCMHDPVTHQPYGGPALVAKYAQDADQMMQLLAAHGVTAYWASIPAFRDGSSTPGELNALYRALPLRWSNARFVDAAPAVLADGGYTDYLPCLSWEPCRYVDPATGQRAARVRAPDGVHFCPTGASAAAGVTATCRVWSSGAWRYGSAMAGPLVHDYRL